MKLTERKKSTVAVQRSKASTHQNMETRHYYLLALRRPAGVAPSELAAFIESAILAHYDTQHPPLAAADNRFKGVKYSRPKAVVIKDPPYLRK